MSPQSTGDYVPLSAITALIVDDNTNTVTLMAEVLRALGIGKIHKAETAAAGWLALQSATIDIVFADVEMPGESGLDLVRQIRAARDPKIAEVVVVMISAQATEARVIAAGAVGANSFLSKPFSIATFARCLTEGFEGRRKALEAAAARPRPIPGHPDEPPTVEV